jgi:hypothetical protein
MAEKKPVVKDIETINEAVLAILVGVGMAFGADAEGRCGFSERATFAT